MKKFRFKIALIFIGFFILFILNSCEAIYSFFGMKYKTEVNFSVSSKSLRNSRSIPAEIEEIFWLDITKEKAKILHKALVAGINTLELDKNGIHLVGFTSRIVDSLNSATSSKDVVGGIQTVGNIQIASVGLDSMPIAAIAQDQINLGTLGTETSGVLISYLDSESASDSLGYTTDTLNSFGIFDSSLTKFLNPDINQNGIFDSDLEDDLEWKLTTLRHYTFRSDEILSDGSPTRPFSELIGNEQMSLVFWLNKNFPHLDKSAVRLVLPPENEYLLNAPPDEAIEGIKPYHDSPLASDGYAQYYFNFGSLFISPKPPFDGDYQLKLGTDKYYFKDVKFLKPAVDTYDGFLFPSTTVEIDENQNLKKLSWRWKAIENGLWRDATPEEVQLKARTFYYYFGSETYRPDQLEKIWYENGTVDISRFGMTTSSQDGGLYCDYWNRAGDDYKFHFLF